jgi:hypothetical protein
MKKEIKKIFKDIYKDKRLLAIQLNGFSHKVFYDNGSHESNVFIEEHSSYLSECERNGRFTIQAKTLFQKFPHYMYQGNAKEIVFIKPNER